MVKMPTKANLKRQSIVFPRILITCNLTKLSSSCSLTVAMLQHSGRYRRLPFANKNVSAVYKNVKDHVKSVLRISSGHNKGGPADINIGQILHLSNFFELKRTLVYIHLQ